MQSELLSADDVAIEVMKESRKLEWMKDNRFELPSIHVGSSRHFLRDTPLGRLDHHAPPDRDTRLEVMKLHLSEAFYAYVEVFDMDPETMLAEVGEMWCGQIRSFILDMGGWGGEQMTRVAQELAGEMYGYGGENVVVRGVAEDGRFVFETAE